MYQGLLDDVLKYFKVGRVPKKEVLPNEFSVRLVYYPLVNICLL